MVISLQSLLFVALGGSIGASLRYVLSSYINHAYGQHFPLGTLVVNILGSFLATWFDVVMPFAVDCCVFVSASVFSVVPVGVLESFSVVTESLESF